MSEGGGAFDMTSPYWPQATNPYMFTSYHHGLRDQESLLMTSQPRGAAVGNGPFGDSVGNGSLGATVGSDPFGAAVGSDPFGPAVGSGSSGAATASAAAVTDNDDARQGLSGPQLQEEDEAVTPLAHRQHDEGETLQQASTRPPDSSSSSNSCDVSSSAVSPAVESPAASATAGSIGYGVDSGVSAGDVNCRGFDSPAASGGGLGNGLSLGDSRQTSVGWRGSDNLACAYPQTLPFFRDGLQLQSPKQQRTQHWITGYCAQPVCTVLACDPWDGGRRGDFQQERHVTEMFPTASSSSSSSSGAVPVAHSVPEQSSLDLGKNAAMTKLVDSITGLAPDQPASKQQKQQQQQEEQQQQGQHLERKQQQSSSPLLIMRGDGRCSKKPSNTGLMNAVVSINIDSDGSGVGGRGKGFLENPTQVEETEVNLVEQQMLQWRRPNGESRHPEARIDFSTLVAKFGKSTDCNLASSAKRNPETRRRSPYRCGKCGQLKSNHTCPYKKASHDAPTNRQPASLPTPQLQPSISQAVESSHRPAPLSRNAAAEYHQESLIARRHVEALIKRENDLKRRQGVSGSSTARGGSTEAVGFSGSTWMTNKKKRKTETKTKTQAVTVITNVAGLDKRNTSLLRPPSYEESDVGADGRVCVNGPDWANALPTKWTGALALADFTPSSVENEWASASQMANQMVNEMASQNVSQVLESEGQNSLTMKAHPGKISDGRGSGAKKDIGGSRMDSSLNFSPLHQGSSPPHLSVQDMPSHQNAPKSRQEIETGATAAEERATGGNKCTVYGAENEGGVALVAVETRATKGLTLPPRMESLENMLYGKGFRPSAANAAAVAAAASAAASAAAATAAAATAAVGLRAGDDRVVDNVIGSSI